MTSGAQTQDNQFAEVSSRLPRCSHQFQRLLLAPEYSLQPPGALGDEVVSGCLYLATKPSHVGG
jgi:hypothetical protein